MQYRELALLWLKTAQGRSQYSEYLKIGEFQPWVSKNEDAGLLYQLAFEVNGAVMTAAQGWRVLMSWEAARLLIVGYNCFAQENGREPLDIEAIESSPGGKLDSFLREWVMLSRSRNLVARGEIFAARDEVLAFLRADDSGTDL